MKFYHLINLFSDTHYSLPLKYFFPWIILHKKYIFHNILFYDIGIRPFSSCFIGYRKINHFLFIRKKKKILFCEIIFFSKRAFLCFMLRLRVIDIVFNYYNII